MSPPSDHATTPAGFRRNAWLASIGTGGWFRSESMAGFVGIRSCQSNAAYPPSNRQTPRATNRSVPRLALAKLERSHDNWSRRGLRKRDRGRANQSVSSAYVQVDGGAAGVWKRALPGPTRGAAGRKEGFMPAGNLLYYALVALVISLIAAFLGFGGIAGTAAGIAQTLFYVFLVIFLVVLVMNFMGRRRGPMP
jgi:uncharacterized membrane protein YtjA (UPF0391 family)